MEMPEIAVNVLGRRPGKEQVVKSDKSKEQISWRESKGPDDKNKNPISERRSFRLSLPARHI